MTAPIHPIAGRAASAASPMGERVRLRANGGYRADMDRADRKTALRGWGFDLALATVGGLFLGAIGPFGSYLNGPFWQRAAFQVSCFWLGTLVLGTGVRLVQRLRLPGTWAWLAVAAMAVVLTAPLSVAIALIARVFWPFLRLTPLQWYVQNLQIALPVTLGFEVLVRRRSRPPAPTVAEPRPLAAPVAQGLLGVAPSQVLCLQMEDHYVRVHTAEGSRLILATLRDAIAALDGAEGLQAHRSWWVARTAVTRAERHGRNLRLRLANGVLAPVARSALPAVRAAGWIEKETADEG